jgi:hypothetical protein
LPRKEIVQVDPGSANIDTGSIASPQGGIAGQVLRSSIWELDIFGTKVHDF